MIENILFMIVGGLIGWYACHRFAVRALADVLNRLGIPQERMEALLEEILEDDSDTDQPETLADPEHTVEVEVELVDEVYYAYRWDTAEFIAQADTPAQLLDRMVQRFPKDTHVNIDIERGGLFFKDLA